MPTHSYPAVLQNRREIRPETKRNEKLGKNVHRADQHMQRIVKKRRSFALEHLVSDNLQGPAEDEQCDRNDPDPGDTDMTGNRGCGQKERNCGGDDGQSDGDIERHP